MLSLQQKGATLAVALIIVMVIALLSIAGIRNAILEEKMSRNMLDSNLSFQSAEYALKTAENYIMSLTTEPIPLTTCTSFPCIILYDATLYISNQNDAWWTSNSAQLSAGAISGVYSQPRYIIQFIKFVPDNVGQLGVANPDGQYYYRITARGIGATSNAITILYSIVSRRF